MMKAVAQEYNQSIPTDKPLKKVSYKKKVANNYEYLREYMMWIYGGTSFKSADFFVENDAGEETLEDLYTIASGGLPEEWFHKVTNKYNLNAIKDKVKSFVENYNLLFSDLQILIGEKTQRPLNYQIINKSFDSGKKQLQDLNDYILNQYMELFNTTSPEQIEQKSEQVEEEINKYKLGYKDAKAYRGQKILDYIIEDDKLIEKIIECWRHYVISAETYVQVRIEDDEVITTPLSPMQVDYEKSSSDYDSKFVQNSDWVAVKYLWSASKVVDELGDYLDEALIDDIDNRNAMSSSWFRSFYYTDYAEKRHDYDRNQDTELGVLYLEWRMLEKYGILKYNNPLTFEEEYMEVDEDFKLTKQMKFEKYEIKWKWRPEIWKGWIIDNKIICGIEKAQIQNGKLSVIGTAFNNLHTKPTSIIKLGLPYLKMWLVLWNKLENVVKKSKGEVAFVPVEVMVGGEGAQEYDLATSLATLENSSIFPYSASNPTLRGQAANNWLGKVNLTAVQEGQFYMQLADRIKQAWTELVGLTPARKGQQKASQGVGSVQAELMQSSAITEFLFFSFAEFEKELLTYVLELSKFAYKEGKHIHVRNDYDVTYLDIEPIDHLFTDYGLFLVNSNRETKQLEFIRDLALQRSNQGASSTELIQLATATSVSELKKIMLELEENESKKIEQQSKSEQEAQERMKALDKEMKQLEAEMEIFKAGGIAEAEFPFKKELELIKLEANSLSFQGTNDTDGDGVPDVNEVEKRSNERLKIMTDVKLKARELQLKDKEINSKERIAKEKNKTDLKNKVVGEK